MFHIHSKVSPDGGSNFYDHISHALDDNIFHARACYVGPSSLDFPERRMMMTPSFVVLDRVLSGKEKGVSIHAIQVLCPNDDDYAKEEPYRVGRVTRITRLNASKRSLPRYLVESTLGNIWAGELDGRLSSCKRTLLFASCTKRPPSVALTEEQVEVGNIGTDAVIRAMDLFVADREKTVQWWWQKHPDLNNKAPSELATLVEYQKLLEVLRGPVRIVQGKGETQND